MTVRKTRLTFSVYDNVWSNSRSTCFSLVIYALTLYCVEWSWTKTDLKDGDDGPEKVVEVLATTVLGSNQRRIAKLAAEQVHPENAAENKTAPFKKS